jgi:hypothetical protein
VASASAAAATRAAARPRTIGAGRTPARAGRSAVTACIVPGHLAFGRAPVERAAPLSCSTEAAMLHQSRSAAVPLALWWSNRTGQPPANGGSTSTT